MIEVQGTRVALLLVVAGISGCLSAPASTTGGQFSFDAATSFFEVNVRPAPEASFSVDWSTAPPAALTFNVHHHGPDGVRFLDNGSFVAYARTFEAPHPESLSLMWTNEQAAVLALEYSITGPVELESTYAA